MERIKTIMAIALLMGFLACNNQPSAAIEETLAGKREKTWRADRELTGGDRSTREARRETMTFSRDGNVRMGKDNDVMTGQWWLTGDTLKVQFTGSDAPESFVILALERDELKLQAGDGSSLTMTPN